MSHIKIQLFLEQCFKNVQAECCLVLRKGMGRGEMSHVILAGAMKLDSAIFASAVWSPCEMSKLKFRLNSMYQSCQKMFTQCLYFS